MNSFNKILLGLGVLLISASCYKIPKEGTVSDLMELSLAEVNVTLGRVHVIGESYGMKINIASTTIPFRFSVERVMSLNEKGEDAVDVTEMFKKEIPMKQWTTQFTGQEKTREELHAKQKRENFPILSFTAANELVFNAASKTDIEPGKYKLYIRVSNSSGSLVLKDALVLNIAAYAPTFQQVVTTTSGEDYVRKTLLEFEKVGEGSSLQVTVIEKDGTAVPIDSLTASSTTQSFNNLFNFGSVSENGITTYDVEYPIPHTPINIYQPYTLLRMQRIVYTRYKSRYDDEGVMRRYLQYGLNFYFGIFEKGDWKLTIRLTE